MSAATGIIFNDIDNTSEDLTNFLPLLATGTSIQLIDIFDSRIFAAYLITSVLVSGGVVQYGITDNGSSGNYDPTQQYDLIVLTSNTGTIIYDLSDSDTFYAVNDITSDGIDTTCFLNSIVTGDTIRLSYSGGYDQFVTSGVFPNTGYIQLQGELNPPTGINGYEMCIRDFGPATFGPTGATGIGITGATGPTGATGSATPCICYNYYNNDTPNFYGVIIDPTLMSMPLAANFVVSATLMSAATGIIFNNIADDSVNLGALLAGLAPGTVFELADASSPTNIAIYTIDSVSVTGNAVQYSITDAGSTGNFIPGDTYYFYILSSSTGTIVYDLGLVNTGIFSIADTTIDGINVSCVLGDVQTGDLIRLVYSPNGTGGTGGYMQFNVTGIVVGTGYYSFGGDNSPAIGINGYQMCFYDFGPLNTSLIQFNQLSVIGTGIATTGPSGSTYSMTGSMAYKNNALLSGVFTINAADIQAGATLMFVFNNIGQPPISPTGNVVSFLSPVLVFKNAFTGNITSSTITITGALITNPSGVTATVPLTFYVSYS
jgi:hypothetical protein